MPGRHTSTPHRLCGVDRHSYRTTRHMATCLDYAKIASAVYHSGTNQYYADPPGHMVDDWDVQTFSRAKLFGNGYQGGIWQNSTDVVVGCCGTSLGNPRKAVQDVAADLKIAAHMIPNQAYNARRMVASAKAIAGGRRVSITGHSLGGGLAQVIAVWEGIPFVSFNAPPMKRLLRLSKSRFNVLSPWKKSYTKGGQNIEDTSGINFRLFGDVVSRNPLGDHVGMLVALKNPAAKRGAMGPHYQANCWQAVMNTDWAFIDPFEAL